MPYSPQRQWPPFSRDARDILKLFQSDRAVRVGGKLVCGLDLEYNPDTNKPTILGLSDGALTVSVPYNDGIGYFKALAARHPDALIAGHNVLGADCVVLAANGINLKTNQIEDTIIRHWLCNSHLCKGGKTSEDGDEGRRGGGWMNLQTFSTLYTSLPVWKECLESECSQGTPCKIHNVFGYNSADALAPVLALPEIRKQCLLKGVEKLYPLHRELMEQLSEMQATGMPVDHGYVNKLQEDFIASRALLETNLPFNPKSPKQVVAYFKDQGIVLPDTSEDTIAEFTENYPDQAVLGLLAEYKAIGKGVDSWFGEKYIGKDGRVHCRLGIFTSTSRMNCTSPNWQNVPARRKDAITGESFKKKIRRAIVAPENHYLVKGDFCVAKGTKVLTTDLRWLNAEDVQVGENLIGFDEETGGYHTRFRKSEVMSSGTLTLPCYRITTTKGEMIASDKHSWVCRRHVKSQWKKYTWIHTEDLTVGDQLAFYCSPWERDESFESGYISGFLDGEGSVSSGREYRHLSFGQNKGKTLDNFLSLLSSKGFDIGYAKNDKKICKCYFRGKNNPSMRALGMFRPERLIRNSERLWDNVRVWGGRTEAAFITKIEFLGEMEVVALKTTTKTFIANGFLSHNSNGENRVMLRHAGYPPITQDLHQWVADQMKLQEDDPFAQRLGGARNAAKSVQHGGNYGEGLSLLGDVQLSSKKIITEERMGARLIFRDWKVFGKTVTFTGINLAQRAFGQATYEARKKALDVQEMYFNNFPKLRELQRRIMKQVEIERCVRPPHGYFLASYGDLTDQLKTALATWGSQPLAHLTKLALLRLRNNSYGIIPALQIHDEIILFVPNEVPPEVAKRVLEEAMNSNTPEMPETVIPIDVSYSTDSIAKELSGGRSTRSNWADTKKI